MSFAQGRIGCKAVSRGHRTLRYNITSDVLHNSMHMPLRLKHWRYRLVTCSCKRARILLRTLSPQQSMIIVQNYTVYGGICSAWSSKAFTSALSKISKCWSALNFWWLHMHMCCKADIECHVQIASVGNLICPPVLWLPPVVASLNEQNEVCNAQCQLLTSTSFYHTYGLPIWSLL